jgi:uridine kinase
MCLDVTTLRGGLAARNARLVGIDGPGGSGKSTLARQLADGWPKAVVIEMDDFYRPSAQRVGPPQVHGGNYDRERLAREVLAPLASGRAGRYQRYDWNEDRLAEWRNVAADAVLLLDGVYSTSEPLRRYLDYTIWVECSYDVRLRRGVERDGEELRATWVNEWMPAEKRYREAERPDARTNLVVNGDGASTNTVVFRVVRERAE